MTCDFCGGQTVKRRVRKTHWHLGKLYLVEDVEAEVCCECGERHYHATTLDAIDRMLESDRLMIRSQLYVQVVGMPLA